MSVTRQVAQLVNTLELERTRYRDALYVLAYPAGWPDDPAQLTPGQRALLPVVEHAREALLEGGGEA